MGSKLKTGQLTYFSRGILSKKWKDGFFCLYEDSTIQWFEKQGEKKPEGSIRIRDVAQYFTVGIYTRSIPERPKIPSHGDENLLICIPKDAVRKEKEVLWIICQDLSQLNEWMTAIVSTLPSATNPSAPALVKSVPFPQQPFNQATLADASSVSITLESDERPTPAHPTSLSRPVQVSNGGSRNNLSAKSGEGGYHVQSTQAVVSSGAAPSHTTVVIQPSNPQVVVANAGGGYAAGDGDFALGMMTGAAISSLAAGPRFGCGSGWSGGPGYGYGDWNGHGSGYGGGYGGHHTVINDGPDYTVNNYTINNVTESSTTTNNNTANSDNYVESTTINFNDDVSLHETHVEYGDNYVEEHESNHYNEAVSDENGQGDNQHEEDNYEGDGNYGDDYGGDDNGCGGDYGGGDYGGGDYGGGDYGGGDYGGGDYGGGDYGGGDYGGGDYGGGDYGGGDYGGGDYGGCGDW